jgi:hypothetical protein
MRSGRGPDGDTRCTTSQRFRAVRAPGVVDLVDHFTPPFSVPASGDATVPVTP